MVKVHIQLNHALWADLERRLGTSDLVEWLENEAERLATLGRTKIGPIVFSRSLLLDRGISLIRAKPFLPALQTIRWTARGYEIAYSPFQRREDRRFGIAHEIMHTFWFAPAGGVRPLSPLQRAIGDDPTIEWLCNRGAAALLLPRNDLVELINKVPYVLHQIPSLARCYLVPERLVARRIFHELAGEHCSIFAVRLQGSSNARRKGVVQWFAPSPDNVSAIKDLKGRGVPLKIMPDVPIGRTLEIEVDGRWWVLMDSARNFNRARPLSTCVPMPPRKVWASRSKDAWYLALPSYGSTCEPS